MNHYDRKYFAKQALGVDPELDWDDAYHDDYDDDDTAIGMDDDMVPDFDDAPPDDDYLFEED